MMVCYTTRLEDVGAWILKLGNPARECVKCCLLDSLFRLSTDPRDVFIYLATTRYAGRSGTSLPTQKCLPPSLASNPTLFSAVR